MSDFQSIGDIAKRTEISARNIQSPIESMLLDKIMRDQRFITVVGGEPKGEGIFVFPQYEIGSYRADFIIKARGFNSAIRVWPPKATCMIAVECDGHDFHTSQDQIEYDRVRDAYFKSRGIDTLRFTGAEIHRNISFVIDQIYEAVKERLWA